MMNLYIVVMFFYLVLLMVGVIGLKSKMWLKCVDYWFEIFNDMVGGCSFFVLLEFVSYFFS